MSFLQIDKLKKSYDKTCILAELSLAINRGEFVSLLGPSGSGKTTALRCIAGLEKPDDDSGTISIDGKIMSSPQHFCPPEDRRLGMVFQSYAVWPHMSVLENVMYPLRIQVKKKIITTEQMKAKAKEALELVKLQDYTSRFSNQLSGGQQQRVALARALATHPEVLLLDEPLSNLDALLREELGAEIRRLQKSINLTTILVTHDQKEALSLSDRIVLLNQGKIDIIGQPEELYNSPPTVFCAEFLASAQKLKSVSVDQEQIFLPRRWQIELNPETAAKDAYPMTIRNRIYLGNEYEYWAVNESIFTEPVRFFAKEKLTTESPVFLKYRT
jgi:ABC-type Fe3+/spermidine/putrescine transport system ATPase subunit